MKSTPAAMEHGAGKLVEEQSYIEVTIKTEVKEEAGSTACYNFEKTSVKEENTIDVCNRIKTEITGNNFRETNKLTTLASNEAAHTVGQYKMLHMKKELEDKDLDMGPSALQHMDSHCGINQMVSNSIKHENATLNPDSKQILIEIENIQVPRSQVGNEIVRSKRKDTNKQTASVPYEAAHTVEQDKLPRIKEELEDADLDIRPSVLQRTDSHCGINQVNLNGNKQENVTLNSDSKQILIEIENIQMPRSKMRNKTVRSKCKGPYTCDYCQKLYRARKTFIIHLDTHGEYAYECSKCKNTFTTKHYLHSHWRKRHPEISRNEKDLSNVRRVRRDGLAANHSVRSTSKPQCDVCLKLFKNKYTLGTHLKIVHDIHDVQTKLELCCREVQHKQPFAGEESAVANTGTRRQDVMVVKEDAADGDLENASVFKENDLNVNVCNKPIHSNGGTSIEDKLTDIGYTCDKCMKIFKSKAKLRVHHQQLHRIESHKCTECNKEFKCKAYLQIHVSRVHSKEQFECTICNKIYKSKRALHSHVSRVRGHIPIGSQTYTCDHCQKSYQTKPILRQHIEGVHGARIYRCEKCDKIFKCNYYLQQHRRVVHDGLRQKCEVCHKLFTSKFSLTAHVKKAHAVNDVQSKSDLHTDELSYIHPIVGDTRVVVNTDMQQHNLVPVKEEPADEGLELGPVVFQHMDYNYRPFEENPQLD